MFRRLIALALATGLSAAGAGPDAARAAEAAPTTAGASAEGRAVVVEIVRFAPRVRDRGFVGTVRPRVEADMGFRVAGKVIERLVQQGERVAAGQVLARLDPTDIELQLEQARAELKAAETSLTSGEAQDRRSLDLRKNGWTTDAAVERQLAATNEIRSRVERARRAVDLAANQLTYAALKADVDGVVTATLAEPGQIVAAGTPVLRLARSGERDAVVAIPEALIERARLGTAKVSLWSNAARTYPARLREFAAAADAATRTYQARFAIEDAGDAAIIGMTATVIIADPDAGMVARLPQTALYARGQGPEMFVVDAATGTLTLKPVKVAGFDGKDVLVGSGLAEGDNVVAIGVHKLDPAQKVRIVETRK
ncbi:MAG: efflux RND transporter periplasmic adaptor subunit [Hyphomicrobiaceae bacterium]|nr:efflux RND transporter periplasmic adaptor subunit [Hyphomicrobiaceae bacterium]